MTILKGNRLALNYEAFDQDDIEEDEMDSSPRVDEDYDPFAENKALTTIAGKENGYQSKKRQLVISPKRYDPFAGEATPGVNSDARTYARVMMERNLQEKKIHLTEQIKNKMKDGTLTIAPVLAAEKQTTRKRRWDSAAEDAPKPLSKDEIATPFLGKWSETPSVHDGCETPGGNKKAWEATPGSETPGRSAQSTPSVRASRWDRTSKTIVATPSSSAADESTTPAAVGCSERKRSRWDETPATVGTPSMTPSMSTPTILGQSTPVSFLPCATPVGGVAMGMATPAYCNVAPELKRAFDLQRDIDDRNRPLTDEEIDAMLPGGYVILQPPKGYAPITPSRKITATPTPMTSSTIGFSMQAPDQNVAPPLFYLDDPSLPPLNKDDSQHFGKLLKPLEGEDVETDEIKILKMILKIKNGTPQMRKSAMRQLTDKVLDFDPTLLFDCIIPIFCNNDLKDYERNYLVKALDRIMYKLDDRLRPYVHQILVVIQPLLVDKSDYIRESGMEVISNLSKAVGLPTMISVFRPNLDNADEYVRKSTVESFSILATTFGIGAILPFLKAVCNSKKSWQAKHTGISIVRRIAILMGCAVLPHLKGLVEAIGHGLKAGQNAVRTITARAIAALAEAATPYGIESFDIVLKDLWEGTRKCRGKELAAFIMAAGNLIPLMDADLAGYYTREVMLILLRELASNDLQTLSIYLRVIKLCCSTDGVDRAYIQSDVLNPFFRHYWKPFVANDKATHQQLIDTTVEISVKVGAAEIISRIVENLKADFDKYRRLTLKTIEMTLTNCGVADIDNRLEGLIIDGLLSVYQEPSFDVRTDKMTIISIAIILNTFGSRVAPYIPQIFGLIRWGLSNKNQKVREQSADLTAKIANVIMACNQDMILISLGQLFYENLGEEYPEVLASILGALKGIVGVVDTTKMNPPIEDLLPRLTPILKNRQPEVQENCIDLIGRIADRKAEYVASREWMRICFELLELLKAHKKSIRRAAVNTFGYIAKAIGPNDVLATLLNNLKVQERQNRVCTTVAIAIVAETCSPFTILPALMNEYRVPELNVQNGVLKSLSFLFEYVGEMSKDYVYAITTLLEDALSDRDLVHRQTAMSAVGHLALGVQGLGCEDALMHLMNFVWPNILEKSLHVQMAFALAIEGMRIALGPSVILHHLMQGLYHPARKIRNAYWKVYNSLYVGSQNALVAAYPRICNDETNSYVRYELEIVL